MSETSRLLRPFSLPFSLFALFSVFVLPLHTISANSGAASDIETPDQIDKRTYSNFVRVGRLGNFVRIGRGQAEADTGADTDTPFSFMDTDKKASSFVRIGKSPWMHRFIRIGRLADPMSSNDEQDFDEYETNAKRASRFVRIGRQTPYEDDKRASSFVRIGKSELGNADDPQSLSELEENIKRASQFVRIGKAPSRFVRIGKAPSRFVRIGKSPSSFVRIGKSPSSFVRIGKSPSSFVRIGKAPSNFVRIGKSPSSFVRIGRAPSRFVRIGRQMSNFLRIGRAADDDTVQEEVPDFFPGSSEYSAGLMDDTLQKRASRFVRIGRSNHLDDQNLNRFLHFGQIPTGDKRASNFVRIGKLHDTMGDDFDTKAEETDKSNNSDSRHESQHAKAGGEGAGSKETISDASPEENEDPIHVQDRSSAFVRIGKIPSSAFVRIGKNSDVMMDNPDRMMGYSRGSRGGHSSFVRIGK